MARQPWLRIVMGLAAGPVGRCGNMHCLIGRGFLYDANAPLAVRGTRLAICMGLDLPLIWWSNALGRPTSKATDSATFAVEVAEDPSWACIAVPDKTGHVESVAYQRGTAWVKEHAKRLVERHHTASFVVQPSLPAGSFAGRS